MKNAFVPQTSLNMNKRILSILRWWLGAMAAGWLGGGAGLAATFNISVGDNFFSPAAQTINIGDTVVWTWTGFFTHNVTSTPTPTPLNSGDKGNGGTFSFTFNSAGSFSYRCTLHGGQTGTITVQAANTPPTITSIANQTILKNFATAALAFTVGDAQTTAGNLTVTGSSGNTPLVPNANIVFGGSGANRTVTVTPAANQFGTATITISVNDGTTTTNTSFQLTVNNPPAVSITSPTNNTTILAGTSPTIQGTATDSDGTVTRVDLYASGFLLGSVTTAPFNPFSFTSTKVSAGNYILTAVATDNAGATNTSAGVNVQVLTNATLVANSAAISAAAFTVSNSFAGQTYFIEALTNLSARAFIDFGAVWFTIATNTASSNNFSFSDTVLTNPFPRLYRVRQTY